MSARPKIEFEWADTRPLTRAEIELLKAKSELPREFLDRLKPAEDQQ